MTYTINLEMTKSPPPTDDDPARRASRAAAVKVALRGRSLVLVGMMGVGKTSIGRRLAAALDMPFIDADVEIETAARMTILEIFERYGEPQFRDSERRVIARILSEQQTVVATGGGAFINPFTRTTITERGVSIWLKADVDVLLQRVRRRSNRPLLQSEDPEQTLRRLTEERDPYYEQADFCVVSQDGPHHTMVDSILETLETQLEKLPRLIRSRR